VPRGPKPSQLMGANEPDRLRAALLATVEYVRVVVVLNGRDRLCQAEVEFKGPDKTTPGVTRDYFLIWRPAVTGSAPNAPARLYVSSSPNADETGEGPARGLGAPWMTDPEKVAAAERELASYPADLIELLLESAIVL
jgi:hypothetical protein